MPANHESEIVIKKGGTKIYHFEMDTENYRINIRTYEFEKNTSLRIENSERATGWIEMFADEAKTIPNLNPSDFATFAEAMPLVKTLVYAFAKRSGVVPDEATIE
ncbi:hypothetical protein OAA08_00995 [bacterium]|nr:hypothetical protein [bacterium]